MTEKNYRATNGNKYNLMRTKILISITVIITILLIFFILDIYNDYNISINNAEKLSQSYALALKEHAERAISEADHAMENTARNIKARGGINSIPFDDLSHMVKTNASNLPQITSIAIMNAKGQMLARSADSSKPLPNLSKRLFYKHHLNDSSESLFISPPFRSYISGKWIFSLTRRINSPNGNFDGVVIAAYDIAYFERLYHEVVKGRNGRVTLATLNGDYLVLVPSDEKVYASGKKTAPFFRKMVNELPIQTYYNPCSNIARERRIVSYNRLERYPVVAITSFGKKEAIAQWRANVIKKSLIISMLSILSLILTRIILQHLKQLDSTNNLLLLKHDQLLKATEDANAATRAKSAFLANMSHEIRTPMNSIIGLTHLALSADLSDKQRVYLNRIQTASVSLLHIINDILDHSKIESHMLEIIKEPIRLDEILQQVADLFLQPVSEKGLMFSLEIGREVPLNIIGDHLRLSQVLNNLVGNAVKFTDSGEIKISVNISRQTERDAELKFTITDTGIGISTEQARYLFEPFTQTDGTISHRYGGTGLGLSISKNLVELMGGTITFESTPGEGSSFYFSIPFALPDHRTEVEPAESGTAPVPFEVEQNLKGSRILLVEDNEVNRYVTTEFLEKAGLVVECANHGGEALKMLNRYDFDLILMDMNMPEMDGIQATGLIRKMPKYAGIPIIAMTAAVTEGDREFCIETGMNDHIPKPVNAVELLEKLSRWINISRGMA